MLDFRWVVKNRKIQPEAAFFPTKNQGLEWMNSNPRMQIAEKYNSENAIVMWDAPELAAQYQKHWQSRWDQGRDFTPSY